MTAPSTSIDKERLQLRLEIGHESQMLIPIGAPVPPPGTHTHRWTVFVRPLSPQASLDQSVVQKVVFQLHEDFPNPKRTLTVPPYEVTETGYAGFIIPIYIHFINCRREYYLEYDMNLKYAPKDKVTEIRTLEFREPKPDLKARLLKAGAEVVTLAKKSKQASSTPTDSFASVFGETIHLHAAPLVQPILKRTTLIKAPSKPAPSKTMETTKISTPDQVTNIKPNETKLSNSIDQQKERPLSKNDLSHHQMDTLKFSSLKKDRLKMAEDAAPSLSPAHSACSMKISIPKVEKLTKKKDPEHSTKSMDGKSLNGVTLPKKVSLKLKLEPSTVTSRSSPLPLKFDEPKDPKRHKKRKKEKDVMPIEENGRHSDCPTPVSMPRLEAEVASTSSDTTRSIIDCSNKRTTSPHTSAASSKKTEISRLSPLFCAASPSYSPTGEDAPQVVVSRRPLPTSSFLPPETSTRPAVVLPSLNADQSLLDKSKKSTKRKKSANHHRDDKISNNGSAPRQRKRRKSKRTDSGVESDTSSTSDHGPSSSSLDRALAPTPPMLLAAYGKSQATTPGHFAMGSSSNGVSQHHNDVTPQLECNASSGPQDASMDDDSSQQHAVTSSQTQATSSSLRNDRPVDNAKLRRLMSLQRRIMTLQNEHVAQRVVDLLANNDDEHFSKLEQHQSDSPVLHCTEADFEFDLFALSDHVVEKLFDLMEETALPINNNKVASSLC